MNFQEADILKALSYEPFTSQKALAESSGHSVGVVNRSLKQLTAEGYIDKDIRLTREAREEIAERSPRNAVILAAGFGMRMVPINLSTPKALLEAKGERLIDRLITQLHAAGVKDITVVVGFMKDHFEYLMDEYDVKLVYNPEYASRNNLHSLALVSELIRNTYIVPCDIWCESNPFDQTELYSWYMVSDGTDEDSDVRVNRKRELVRIPEKDAGNAMVGISYLTEPEARTVREKLKAMDVDANADCFWEETLYHKDRMIVRAKVAGGADVVEINTYEQLRDLDSDSSHLQSDAIRTIAGVMDCRENEIVKISVLKKGMTNRSFLFSVAKDGTEQKYIMRIPGEGTDQLIDRRQEVEVFRTISGRGLCDDPVYINPENGYKITRFLEGVRVCDCLDVKDLRLCMAKLREFHQMKLQVPHVFDIFEKIEFYESLWEGDPSIYRDYKTTKQNVLSLKPFIDSLEKDWCLTHIDAVPDNFLFYTPEGETQERLQLTDWEYAGMQDPHVDLAMFCVYSLYDKPQCDQLIDIYFENGCDRVTRAKIYAYIAMCGLLWSNWCEFKRKFDVEFGEYSLRQYRFAKEFYRYSVCEMNGAGDVTQEPG